eukprot:scaffold360_cov374-Pavlova_lutheri.AAC.7
MAMAARARVCLSSSADELRVRQAAMSASRVRFDVTVPKRQVQRAFEDVVTEYQKEVTVPGYRKGSKVPLQVLAQKVGQENLRSAAVELIMRQTMWDACAAVRERALEDSERLETSVGQLLREFSTEKDFEYAVSVEIVPEIGWKKSYKGLHVEVQAAGDDARAQAEVEHMVHEKKKDLGTLRVVVDRGLERGDVAVISFDAKKILDNGDDGEEIVGAKRDSINFDTGDGDSFLPGLVEGVLGAQRGEERKMDLVFPNNWKPEALRGVKGRFTVKVQELFVRDLPTDEAVLASALFKGATTLQEAVEKLIEVEKKAIEEATEARIQEAILAELAEAVDLVAPEYLVEEQGKQQYAAKLLELQALGQISYKQIESMSSEKMLQEYIQSEREQLERIVKSTMAVEEIFKLEGLTVSSEEIQAEVQRAEEEFKQMGEQFDQEKLTEQAQELLKGGKVLSWLKANSNITMTPPAAA